MAGQLEQRHARAMARRATPVGDSCRRTRTHEEALLQQHSVCELLADSARERRTERSSGHARAASGGLFGDATRVQIASKLPQLFGFSPASMGL